MPRAKEVEIPCATKVYLLNATEEEVQCSTKWGSGETNTLFTGCAAVQNNNEQSTKKMSS